MKKIIHPRDIIGIAVICLSVLVIFSTSCQAEDLKALRGDPFSDPDYVQDMPPEWINQPITYDETIGDADLVITLNQQFSEFLEPIIKQYETTHKLKIVVKPGTCGMTASMLSNKKGDIGGFCCPPAKTDRLSGLQYHTIGIFPISILVHPENPVQNLTLEQVRMIFHGDTTRWSEVGGNDKPIYLIGRLHCKKRPGHWRLILDNDDLFAPELQSVGAIEDMFSLVDSHPDAIGYEVMWMNERSAAKVKPLNINGHASHDLKYLLTGDYPFYRVLNLSTWESDNVKNPKAQKLVQYIKEEIEKNSSTLGILPASRLRQAGWKFKGPELTGEPK